MKILRVALTEDRLTEIVDTAPAADMPDIADPINVVAKGLNISIPTLYREVSRKRLRMCKIAGRSVIFRSDRAAYIRLLKAEADTNPEAA